MALSSHTSPLISTSPGIWMWTAIFRVQLRKLVNEWFNSSGENIDPAPWEQDLHRGCCERTFEAVDRGQYRFKALSKSWTALSTTKASSDWVSANVAKIPGGLNRACQCCIKPGPIQVSTLPGCCKIERCTHFEDFVVILRMRRILLIMKLVRRHLKMNLIRKCCSNCGCFQKC
jgi:hypothetical protein